jgi:hypothetical protein
MCGKKITSIKFSASDAKFAITSFISSISSSGYNNTGTSGTAFHTFRRPSTNLLSPRGFNNTFNNNSLNGVLFNTQKIWFFNSFELKPNPLKNWKNKCKVHLNFKKLNLKRSQMDFKMENERRKELPCMIVSLFLAFIEYSLFSLLQVHWFFSGSFHNNL